MKIGRSFVLLGVALACGGASALMPACSNDDGASDAASDQSSQYDNFVVPADSASDTNTQMDAGPDVVDANMGCTAPDAALSDASVQSGKALLLQFKCYACHQEQPLDAGLILSGKKTSIVDGGAPVYPANITPDTKTGIGCWTDDQIRNAILNGVDDMDASLCVMPRFNGKLDGGEVQDLISFLRSLPAVSNQIPPSMCPMMKPPQDAGGG